MAIIPAPPFKTIDNGELDSHAAAMREWDTVRAAAKSYTEAMEKLTEAATSLAPATGDKLTDLAAEVKRKEDWLRRAVVDYSTMRIRFINGMLDGDNE